MPDDLHARFDASLLAAAQECFRIGYKPTEFIRMIHERGGVETARSLLHSSAVSSGFDRLWEKQRLDLTLEAHILQPEWHPLFTTIDRTIARKRLSEYRYKAPWDVAEAGDDDDRELDAEPAPETLTASARPSGGMFGVKLIYPDHLKFPYFCEVYSPDDPRRALMNFKGTARNSSAAAAIPTGHRALVFTRQHVVWAIEIVGPMDDGSLLAMHGVTPHWPSTEWSVFRPIRFLARMNVTADSYQRGMHRHEIQEKTGVTRRSYGGGHFYVTADEYQCMYEVVPWDWKAGDESKGTMRSAPPAPVSRPAPPRAPEFIQPPLEDAAGLLELVRAVAGKPERNMEDAVKEFLVRLGVPRSAVRFQIGHVDVAVDGANGKSLFVFEVKRSLTNGNIRNDALRQGFDYANRTGARYVVISDADRYEIYDRKRGLDHASMLCGSFQLTAFRAEHTPLLDVLRSRE